jgi:hypothetical protein
MPAIRWMTAVVAAFVLAGCAGGVTGPPVERPSATVPVPDAVGPHAWVPFASATEWGHTVLFADGTSHTITANTPVQGVMAVDPDGEARESVIVATVDGVAELPIDDVAWTGEYDHTWSRIVVDGDVIERGGQTRELYGVQYARVAYDATGDRIYAQIQDVDGSGWMLADGDDVIVRGDVEGVPEPSIRTGWLSGESRITRPVTAVTLDGEEREVSAHTPVGHLVAMDAPADPTEQVPVIVDGELMFVPGSAVAHVNGEQPGARDVTLDASTPVITAGGRGEVRPGHYPDSFVFENPDGTAAALLVAAPERVGGWALCKAEAGGGR